MRVRFSLRQKMGLGLLIFLLLLVVIEALFYEGDPAAQHLSAAFEGPSWQEPLGRDHYGRSNFSRLANAIFTSVLLALLSVMTSAVLGLFAGTLAAWKGGWWERCCTFVVNILLALPGLILVLLLGAMLPGSFLVLYCAIALILWVEYFRVVRSRTLSVLQSPEIEASRLYGFSSLYLFKRHIWPELQPDLVTLSCFGAGNAILALASVGFLHVGLKPPDAELGLMMVELFRYYHQAPWVLLQPIAAVCFLVLGFQLLSQTESSS